MVGEQAASRRVRLNTMTCFFVAMVLSVRWRHRPSVMKGTHRGWKTLGVSFRALLRVRHDDRRGRNPGRRRFRNFKAPQLDAQVFYALLEFIDLSFLALSFDRKLQLFEFLLHQGNLAWLHQSNLAWLVTGNLRWGVDNCDGTAWRSRFYDLICRKTKKYDGSYGWQTYYFNICLTRDTSLWRLHQNLFKPFRKRPTEFSFLCHGHPTSTNLRFTLLAVIVQMFRSKLTETMSLYCSHFAHSPALFDTFDDQH